MSRAAWLQSLQGAKTICSPTSSLWALSLSDPVSALTRALFDAALSIIFSFLDFVSGDLALTEF